MKLITCLNLALATFVLQLQFLVNITYCNSGKPCSDLLMGQYRCASPDIDFELQREAGCTPEKKVNVSCYPVNGIVCDNREFDGETAGFEREIPCIYTNGTSWEVALLLSIFLGMFGVDRFYLGYPAIGLLKLSTLGFGFLGQLIDIILIASQVVNPADGSSYVMSYYGARLQRLEITDATYYKPQTYD